jgi:hypothetical protein
MVKTELLSAISAAKGIEAVSTLTPHALVSGMNLINGHDPSLIPRLNNRVLVIKDFTTVLSMQQQAREEINGVLRDAYDGEITKIFGTGTKHYKSKFGIIAGVTPIIDAFMEAESALGERFLRFRFDPPQGMEEQAVYLRKAVSNIGTEDTMRSTLRAVSSECLNYDFGRMPLPVIPTDMEDRLIYLSVIVSMLRGTVTRDKYSREITTKPFIEIGTRLAKQFTKLLYGIGQFRCVDTVGEYEFSIIKTIALSTIPEKMEMFIKYIFRTFKAKAFEASSLCEVMKLPAITVQRQLENMHVLNIVKKSAGAGATGRIKSAWALTNDILTMIKKIGLFT